MNRFRFVLVLLALALLVTAGSGAQILAASTPYEQSVAAAATSRFRAPAAEVDLCLFAAPPPDGHRLALPAIVKGSTPRGRAPDAGAASAATATSWIPPRAVEVVPPDPAPADFAKGVRFLYEGPQPIQRQLASGAIDPERAAVVRGRVCNRSGQPLPGVTVTVLDHPEYGLTATQPDGLFDMVVNGGGFLTVDLRLNGYLPVQRQIEVPWNGYAWIPDVSLIQADGKVTTVALGGSTPLQVAQGSAVADGDGRRQATLLFAGGTEASIYDEAGSTQTVSSLDVRLTEYTVGESGPASMPAEMPQQIAYTYAVELGADEATVKVGGKDVLLSKPATFYLDNFLDFPAGIAVPTGYYDSDRGTWVPAPSGRVVAITGESGGAAQLDVDGDGNADGGSALAALDITADELAQLARLYDPGKSLWRVQMDHLSTWDLNWGFGPPDDARPPRTDPEPEDQPEDEPDEECGSVIDCQNQILREWVSLAGTPFDLYYSSERSPGRAAANALFVQLTGEESCGEMDRVQVEWVMNGRRLVDEYICSPGLARILQGEATDPYGRAVNGAQPVSMKVGYTYPGVYSSNSSFGSLDGVPITGSETRQEVTLWQEWQGTIGTVDARSYGLGGWTLGVHHFFDRAAHTLHLGDGTRRNLRRFAGIIDTIAGTNEGGFTGDGQLAVETAFGEPAGVAYGPDGSLYIADAYDHRVRRVGPDGIVSTVAGTGEYGFSGDGGPALEATFREISDVAWGPDGSLYIADVGNGRVRRVGPEGIIETLAGNGLADYNGDGIPANEAQIANFMGIDVGRDGSLYIADTYNQRIRRVGPDGIISTVAGTGDWGYNGDGIRAVDARLDEPYDVVVAEDGSLYIADSFNERVRRVGPDGMISTIAGTGEATSCPQLNAATATSVEVCGPMHLAPGRDGSLYIATADSRVERLLPGGSISTVAGSGEWDYYGSGDGGPATEASFTWIGGLAVAPDGSLVISDHWTTRVRRVAPPLLRIGDETFIAAEDGSVVYAFDDSGRHRRTLHALTGATLYQFTYGANGLASVTDGDGNVTTIERDGSGAPSAIVAPYGQRTALQVNGDGYLAQLTNPAAESYTFYYTPSGLDTPAGLLNRLLDPQGNQYDFAYDSLGRLWRETNPAGRTLTLEREGTPEAYEVSVSSRLGRTTTYAVRSNGTTTRTNTMPDGTVAVAVTGIASSQSSSADGARSAAVLGGDPRWGMLAPLQAQLWITPSTGINLQQQVTRTATVADPADPFSLQSQREVWTRNGRAYHSTYDAGSRTFTDITPEGRQLLRTIDDQGRMVLEQHGELAPASYSYDSHGLPQSVSSGARTTAYAYNSAGLLASLTNPLGQVEQFNYDEMGRLLAQTDAGSGTTGFGYDENGRLASITPPGRPAHTLERNEAGLPTAYVAPGGSVTRYQYNEDQQLVLKTLPGGRTVSYAYDAYGRISSTSSARGTISYGYDASSGRVSRINAPAGVALAHSYNGSLFEAMSWSGPVAGRVSFSYDDDLRLAGDTVNGAHAVSYRYDDDGLLVVARNLTLVRDPANGLIAGTSVGSVGDSRGYNSFGEPSSYRATFGSNLLYQESYTRDALGRISTRTEAIGGNSTTYGYEYDAAGRLLRVTAGGSELANYSYDANGNRLSIGGPGGSASASYDQQDRLLQQGSTSYSYRADGVLQRKTTGSAVTGYDYDDRGNLLALTLPDGSTISYLVDGLDRRVGRRVDGTLVQGFLYGDDLNPVAELDGSGNVVNRFVYGSRRHVPDLMIKQGTSYRILSDHLGSVRLVVNVATGAVAQRLDYDPWGMVLQDTNPGFQPFGFAGGLYEAATGLVRFGARDYDAAAGRWTAPDPIRFAGGQTNLYSYLGNDPVNRIDPAGYGKPGMLSHAWNWTKRNAGDVADWAVEKGKQAKEAYDEWKQAREAAEIAAEAAAEVAEALEDPGAADPEGGADLLTCILDFLDLAQPVELMPTDAARETLDRGLEHARHQRDYGTINRGAARQMREAGIY